MEGCKKEDDSEGKESDGLDKSKGWSYRSQKETKWENRRNKTNDK